MEIRLVFVVVLLSFVQRINSQDYQVSDIVCHETSSQGGAEILTARLKKPPGFRGHPAFADNRKIKPSTDEHCRIWLDPEDNTKTVFRLKLTDFTRCPVFKANGFVHVKIWFPRLDGVVMFNDQDVVIKCKPPEAIVHKNKSTGFTGSLYESSSTRVSGIVEETPGKLEYELALFQESTPRSGNFDFPVDGAVAIGTLLQLRAAINTHSAWRYLKLMEVTVSTERGDPYSSDHITLVKDGCRLKEYESIVPEQPTRIENKPGEVTLNFEAFMLENMISSSQMWLHSQIKACIEAVDCLPEFCMDLFQPSGYGKRKRRAAGNHTTYRYNSYPAGNRDNHHLRAISSESREVVPDHDSWADAANIGENIGITVVVPGLEALNNNALRNGCTSFLALAAILAILLLFSTGVVVVLARRINRILGSKFSSVESIYSGSSTYSNYRSSPPVVNSVYTGPPSYNRRSNGGSEILTHQNSFKHKNNAKS